MILTAERTVNEGDVHDTISQAPHSLAAAILLSF